MMVIKKSIRTRHRYLLIRSNINGKDLLREIMRRAYKYLGILSIPKIEIIESKDNLHILRISRKEFNKVRIALILENEPRIILLKSSGTLRGIKEN